MRRKLLLSIFIMLNFCLVGQVSYEYQYWFDSDTTISYSEESTSNIWQKSVDLSHLDEGVHSIHVQVKDTSEKWSSPLTKYFMKLSSEAPMKYHYWFDEDSGIISGEEFVNGIIMLDLDSVSDGLHYLNLQVEQNEQFSDVKRSMFYKVPRPTMSDELEYKYWFDNDSKIVDSGRLTSNIILIDVDSLKEGVHSINILLSNKLGVFSLPLTKYFMKLSSKSPMKYHYWFDEDNKTISGGEFANGIMMLDLDSVSDGLHYLNLQVEQNDQFSDVKRSMFYKVPQTEGIDSLMSVVLLNQQIFKKEKVATQNGLIHWDLDVSELSHGLHTLQFLFVTPSGAATDLVQRFFFKTMQDNDLELMKFYYKIDDEEVLSSEGTSINNAFHFDVDVSSISDGLHRITYFMGSDKLGNSNSKSSFFYKIPLGGNGIKEYHYWFNENEENKRVIKLTEPQSSYNLMTLLPTDTCPIRTKCFHFEVQDSVPMVFAKNNFFLRFFDVSDRCVDLTKQYIDYNVKEEITDITELEESGTYKFARPDENKIKWFKFEAKRGELILVNTDQGCSIDIFSSSGENFYNAIGVESIKANGFYVGDDSIYYIAIHDASANNNMNLKFKKIDKYICLQHTHNKSDNIVFLDININGN